MRNFNKSKLPAPEAVLRKIGIQVGKISPRGYFVLHCPFHKDGAEHNPSLNLHSENGHYRCHACGAKGGDILNFYMKVTNQSFRDAAKELGAWEVKL